MRNYRWIWCFDNANDLAGKCVGIKRAANEPGGTGFAGCSQSVTFICTYSTLSQEKKLVSIIRLS